MCVRVCLCPHIDIHNDVCGSCVCACGCCGLRAPSERVLCGQRLNPCAHPHTQALPSTALTSLSVDVCGLGDAGAARIASGLAANRSLTLLNLASNGTYTVCVCACVYMLYCVCCVLCVSVC